MSDGCLSLLSDYGDADGFVGICRAVALGIAPQVPFIDISHAIAAHNVREGAFVLAHSIGYVPPGVHVAVVDPGVGGDRRAIAVRCGDHIFVGPDNGLLVWAIQSCGGAEAAVVLDKARFWLSPRAKTFDGRDIFVPVGAHLALGVALEQVGSSIGVNSLVELESPILRQPDAHSLEVEVIRVDGFGNIQTTATAESLAAIGIELGDLVELVRDGASLRVPYADSYEHVDLGEALVLIDSDRCLALSRNTARADLLFPVGSGQLLQLRRAR